MYGWRIFCFKKVNFPLVEQNKINTVKTNYKSLQRKWNFFVKEKIQLFLIFFLSCNIHFARKKDFKAKEVKNASKILVRTIEEIWKFLYRIKMKSYVVMNLNWIVKTPAEVLKRVIFSAQNLNFLVFWMWSCLNSSRWKISSQQNLVILLAKIIQNFKNIILESINF